MQLDADRRLCAAAGGAGRYFADAAGLANSAVSGLQSAIVAVCNREIERHQGIQGNVWTSTVTRTPDRIAVVMRRRATENGSSAKDSDLQEQGIINGVDQVQHETQAEMAITRLTKYVGEEASASSRTFWLARLHSLQLLKTYILNAKVFLRISEVT